ncbi:hypothetical protein [Gynuella sp.]|uniref:hypothetical protein n=1 Tax=Gynuella sp. TaxID=2969146 RepID=UPI003D114CED
MSASIEYSVIGDISFDSLEEVNAEIARISGDYEWYIEPAILIESSGSLTGASKLFRLFDEDGEELDPADESPKVMSDIKHLIDVLTDFSARKNISWELAIEGTPIGNLAGNGPDEILTQTLGEMATAFGGAFETEVEVPVQETKQKKPWWKFW